MFFHSFSHSTYFFFPSFAWLMRAYLYLKSQWLISQNWWENLRKSPLYLGVTLWTFPVICSKQNQSTECYFVDMMSMGYPIFHPLLQPSFVPMKRSCYGYTAIPHFHRPIYIYMLVEYDCYYYYSHYLLLLLLLSSLLLLLL